MKTLKSFFTFFVLYMLSGTIHSQNTNAKRYLYDAAISPSNNEIVFVSGGDIWTVPFSGGEARLLISHPAAESRPLYSPDGRHITFNSSRTGNGDIYVLTLQSGKLNRLTFDDANDEVNAWSSDGKYIYFTSTSKDITGMRDVLRIKATGGTPMAISDNRYVTEFFAAPAPDNKTLALVARGMGAAQWWRNGRSHLDESELWLMDEHTKKYTRIADKGAKQLWPMWSADGKTLYYVSDRNGKQNIWMKPLNGVARQLTQFNNGRVLFPSISKDGKTIVFEREFGLYKMNIATNEVQPVDITLKGISSSGEKELKRLTSGFSDLSLSRDGKKLAFTAQGKLFVAGAKDGGDAVLITNTPGFESSPVWTKNSNSVLYVSERDDKTNIYEYNFILAKEERLTNTNGKKGSLTLSPDGKKLAFISEGTELRVLDLASKQDNLLTKSVFSFSPISSGGSISWSPDGRHIAYASHGTKFFRNVYVIPSTGGEGRPVSFLANTFGGEVVWGNDGNTVFFTTTQRTENAQVARVDLVPHQPLFKEDKFRDLFTEISPPAKATKTDTATNLVPLKLQTSKAFVFGDIRNRLSLLPLGVDVQSIDITRDGNTLIVLANIAGQYNIYSYPLDELAKEPPVLKQLTTTAGLKNNVQLSNDGKEVYFIEGGKINSVNIESKQLKPVNITAELSVDFDDRKLEVFQQAWELQNRGFYDEGFHGVNWNNVKAAYRPYAAGAQTPDELIRLLNLMVGELNASHLGVASNTPPAFSVGHLGLKFNRNTYEDEGMLKVLEVVRLGPADLAGIKEGDVIKTVDGYSLTTTKNLDELLENKLNRRVYITVASGGKTREVVVKPVSLNIQKGLLYKQWVQEKRDYVEKISNGRLGYVHMIDMSQSSLDQLYLDIDAQNHAREGVVVDIRNNNGGFVNAYALDVLSRKGFMNMQVRGRPAAPARVQLGQRALDAPTILVTNQHSLSDAEDFSEGYRTLGLGKIVGEPTAGWIIYTSNIPLFDGTIVRLPFIKITDHEGKNMELAPRPVDIAVSNDLGDAEDEQLNVAVKELLKQLDNKSK